MGGTGVCAFTRRCRFRPPPPRRLFLPLLNSKDSLKDSARWLGICGRGRGRPAKSAALAASFAPPTFHEIPKRLTRSEGLFFPEFSGLRSSPPLVFGLLPTSSAPRLSPHSPLCIASQRGWLFPPTFKRPLPRALWRRVWKTPLGTAAALVSLFLATSLSRDGEDEDSGEKAARQVGKEEALNVGVGFAKSFPCPSGPSKRVAFAAQSGAEDAADAASTSAPRSSSFARNIDWIFGGGGWEGFVRFSRSFCALTLSTIDYKLSLRRVEGLRRQERQLEKAILAAKEAAARSAESEELKGASSSVAASHFCAEVLRLESELQSAFERREAALQRLHQRCARRLLSVCIAHGGLYTKVGQYLATLNHVLPPAYTATLSQLLDDAARVPWAEAKQLLEEELGAPLESLFSEFDSEAVAAASLAQVHRARRKADGAEVAVKLQRPRLRRHVSSDLAALRILMALITSVFPEFEFQWLLPEFEKNMRQELNFLQEGFNAMRLRRLFAHSPQVYVPWVDWQLTTPRVLTMEFVRGAKLSDRASLEALGLESDAVAKVVMRVFGDMLCVHGFVHCDPHPGNLLVRRAPRRCRDCEAASRDKGPQQEAKCAVCKDAGHGEAQLVVLDHGMYRRLEPEFRLAYCRLWRALLLNSLSEGRAALRELTRISQSPSSAGDSSASASEEAPSPPLKEDFALDLLSVVLTHRPQIGLRSRLGEPMHSEDKARVLEQLRLLSVSGVNDFLRRLPRDLLWVLRMTNIVRSLNSHLGGNTRERLVAMGEAACRGAQLGNESLNFKLEECADFLEARQAPAETAAVSASWGPSEKTRSFADCLYTPLPQGARPGLEAPDRAAPRWHQLPGASSLNLPVASEFPAFHFRLATSERRRAFPLLGSEGERPSLSSLLLCAEGRGVTPRVSENAPPAKRESLFDPLESLYTQMVILNGRREREPLSSYRGLHGERAGETQRRNLLAFRTYEEREARGRGSSSFDCQCKGCDSRRALREGAVLLSSLRGDGCVSAKRREERPASRGGVSSADAKTLSSSSTSASQLEAPAPWRAATVSEALFLKGLQIELWITLAVLRSKLCLFDALMTLASGSPSSAFGETLPEAPTTVRQKTGRFFS